jgi:hypothetical protein
VISAIFPAPSTTFCAAALTAFGYVRFGDTITRPIAATVPRS